MIVPLFVSDAGWEVVSNFTVIRGIGGVANGDACDGSVWSVFNCDITEIQHFIKQQLVFQFSALLQGICPPPPSQPQINVRGPPFEGVSGEKHPQF